MLKLDKKIYLMGLFISIILFLPTIVSSNLQGLETIDCNTRQLKDTFTTNEDVCIKQTRISPGNDCGDPNDAIQAYVLSYRTNWNTPDGSFFYTDGRSLVPYVKKIAVTINNDRSIYWNLGKFLVGSYDVAQGGNDYRGNNLYQGGCFDELGSPLVSAGFDIVSDGSPAGQACIEEWNCGQWVCAQGKITRGCTDLNGCGTTSSKPQTEYSGFCDREFAKSDNPQDLLAQGQTQPPPLSVIMPATIIQQLQQIPSWFFIGILILASIFVLSNLKKRGKR